MSRAEQLPQPEYRRKRTRRIGRRVVALGAVAASFGGIAAATGSEGEKTSPTTTAVETSVLNFDSTIPGSSEPASTVEVSLPETTDVSTPTTEGTLPESTAEVTTTDSATASTTEITTTTALATTSPEITTVSETFGNINLGEIDPGPVPLSIEWNGQEILVPRLDSGEPSVVYNHDPDRAGQTTLANIAAFLTTGSPEVLNALYGDTDPNAASYGYDDLVELRQMYFDAHPEQIDNPNLQFIIFDKPDQPVLFNAGVARNSFLLPNGRGLYLGVVTTPAPYQSEAAQEAASQVFPIVMFNGSIDQLGDSPIETYLADLKLSINGYPG